ncbi:arginine repressor [Ligilactobacillus sp. LYQ60]|uniref:arginine repressor n=1 Tax=unclassified Ligilactobacillus TaxID=2767920 RepID=UPI00385533F1
MQRQARQQAVKRLLQDGQYHNQAEIVTALAHQGIHVTQATVSRDLTALRVEKATNAAGVGYYRLPTAEGSPVLPRLERTVRGALVGIRVHDSMCALQVLPGNGPALAHLIEQAQFPTVFAALANDAMVVVFMNNPAAAKQFADQVMAWSKEV